MYNYALVLDKEYDKHWLIESQEPIEKEAILSVGDVTYIVDTKGVRMDPDSSSVLWILSAIPADQYIAELQERAL